MAPTPSPSATSLSSATVAGVRWTWAAMALITVMQLGYAAIMGRLVEPAAFGVLAGAMLAVQYVQYLARLGLASAIIQRPELHEADLRTAHLLSVLSGVVGGLVVVSLAPVLSALLDEPEVRPVVAWLGLAVAIAGFGAVPEARLRREMRFRALATVQVTAYAVGNLVVAVALAVRGWGVEALVAAVVVNALAAAVLHAGLAGCSWSFGFAADRARRLVSFGGRVSVSSLLDVIGQTVDRIAIGRWLGADPLGQYSRAMLLVGLPVEQASTSVVRVVTPALTRVQRDRARFGAALTSTFGIVGCLVAVPIGIAAAVAPAAVRLVLGPGWEVAGSVLPIVGMGYGFKLLTQLVTAGAEACGAVQERLVAQWFSLLAIVALIGLVGVVRPTLHGLAMAWMVGSLIRLVIHLRVAVRHLGVEGAALGRRLIEVSALGAAAAVPGIALVRVGGADGLFALAASALGSVLVVAALWPVTHRWACRRDLERAGMPRALLSRVAR